MKKGFNWQTDLGDEAWEEQEKGALSRRRRVSAAWVLGMTAVFIIALAAVWVMDRRQVKEDETAVFNAVQAALNAEYDAFLAGDGTAYFALMDEPVAWQTVQRRFGNMAASRAGYTVTHAEVHGKFVWADVRWQEDGSTFQRVLFFQWDDEGRALHRVANAPDYWGNWNEVVDSEQEWGTLSHTRIDEPYVEEIADAVAELIDEACAADCLHDRLPLTVVLTPDFSQTAVANTIHIPSPRLFALDEDGEIDGRFYHQLRQSIMDRITPATIRFALPPIVETTGVNMLDYEQIAADFMAANPHITVELTLLDALPDDLAELTDFDGAAVSPTADMIASGLLLDLTDLADSDPDFEPSDFYERIWQAAVWHDRLWFVPQTADFRLLYYDKSAYRAADLSEPSWQWNWGEMAADRVALIAAQPSDSAMIWGFLDIGRDALFAYAYSESNRCQANCPSALQPQQMQEAFQWYAELVHQGQMPDMGEMDAAERAYFMRNNQSANRRAAIWVGDPALFEYYTLLELVGAAPFPGHNVFNGSTPLWVEGSFISAGSERPYATWQWIRFLSKQAPFASFRHVPARPSSATEIGFWTTLPEQIANPMRAAFNDARPVTIEDKLYFSQDVVTAVVDGTMQSDEAANTQPPIAWFGIHE